MNFPYSKAFPPLQSAIAEWQAILGAQYVLSNSSTLESYAASCSTYEIQARAVVEPSTLTELMSCLSVARRYQLPVYVFSGGKNWGYGSRSPAEEENTIFDLHRMNQIIEVSTDLAYAVVEPGVTQQQLYDYLEANHPTLMMDVTGASTGASLIGNLSERGSGFSPYSDHFSHCCSLEVLLADGTLINTGFGRFPHGRAKNVNRWGLGPSLDGLFTQSNFGIITKATIWLMPKPEQTSALIIEFQSDQQLAEAVGPLCNLKLRRILEGTPHIVNDVRFIASMMQYPFYETGGQVPLPEETLQKLRKRMQIAPWNFIGGLWGTSKQIKLAFREVQKGLKNIAKPILISDPGKRAPHQSSSVYNLIRGETYNKKLSILNLLKGIPTNAAQRGAYWRKRKPAVTNDFDPDRDECGLIWCSPVVPLLRDDILAALKITRDVPPKYTFETNLSVSLLTERAAVCTVAIAYDKEIQMEQISAELCHRELLKQYYDAGFVPYRLGSVKTAEHELLFGPDCNFSKFCRNLKRVVDPTNILAPGKYTL